MMKSIVFDLNHPVDVNFFKNAIKILLSKQFDVKVIFRPRGKLEKIASYELPVELIPIGKHYKSFFRKIIGQLTRDFKLISYLKSSKCNLIVCFGPTSVISAKLLQIPYLAFDDDFEYKIPFYHANLFATKHIYPDYISFSNKKVFKYHGFKELAYLHPNYYKPNIQFVKDLGISENEYVFIRHISNVSLNYSGKNFDLSDLIYIIKKFKYKIVLSIEDKSICDCLDSDVIVLNEPLPDVFSFMNYSILAISYGDTVARECSLLGVPTFYMGGRNMCMHKELVESGLMIESQNLNDIESYLTNDVLNNKLKCKIISQKKILKEWDDTTKIILEQIQKYL